MWPFSSKKLLILALALSGCASPAKSYRFPEIGLKVDVMSPQAQKEKCAPNVETTWDDGTPRPAGIAGAGRACFIPWENLIVLPWGASAETLIHELCHAAGRPEAECADIP